jgi:hypothetical protein
MLQPLIDALYWLTLSAWFGAVLISAVVPPVILRVIRQADPTLPRVLSVNLDKQHSTLLAGDVVGEILQTLFRLEWICAIGFFLPLVGRWFYADRTGANLVFPLMVSALYLLAVAFLFYGSRIVWPKVLAHRTKYVENADDPDIANAELDHFDRYSGELFSVVRNMLFALLGAILFSAVMKLNPAGTTISF